MLLIALGVLMKNASFFFGLPLLGTLYFLIQAMQIRDFRKALISFVFMLLLLLLASFQALDILTHKRISEVRRGTMVTPISYAKNAYYPIVGIKAMPARATWLDSTIKPSTALNDPFLLYLGHGNRGEVLFACGNVLTLPSSKAAIEDGDYIDRSSSRAYDTHKKACGTRSN